MIRVRASNNITIGATNNALTRAFIIAENDQLHSKRSRAYFEHLAHISAGTFRESGRIPEDRYPVGPRNHLREQLQVLAD